jgi:thiamine-monophosphate kinase
MTSVAAHSDKPTRVAVLVEAFPAGQTVPGHGPDAPSPAGTDGQDDYTSNHLPGPVTLVVGSDHVRAPTFALHGHGPLANVDIGYRLAAASAGPGWPSRMAYPGAAARPARTGRV